MRNDNGKLDVPRISWLLPLITPSSSTLLFAFNIWYFNSRLIIICLNLVIFFFAYFYAVRPHRLWHISRAPNTGLLGWFLGSVILSLLIYFTVILPSILLRFFYVITLCSQLVLLEVCPYQTLSYTVGFENVCTLNQLVEIWPDYGYTIFSFLMVILFVMSLRYI